MGIAGSLFTEMDHGPFLHKCNDLSIASHSVSKLGVGSLNKMAAESGPRFARNSTPNKCWLI